MSKYVYSRKGRLGEEVVCSHHLLSYFHLSLPPKLNLQATRKFRTIAAECPISPHVYSRNRDMWRGKRKTWLVEILTWLYRGVNAIKDINSSN